MTKKLPRKAREFLVVDTGALYITCNLNEKNPYELMKFILDTQKLYGTKNTIIVREVLPRKKIKK